MRRSAPLATRLVAYRCRSDPLFRHPVGQNHRLVASREAESLASDLAGHGTVVGAVPPGQAISVSDGFDMQVEIADQFVFRAEVLNVVITGEAVRRVARCPAPTDRAAVLDRVRIDPARIDDVFFLSAKPIFANPDPRRMNHAGHDSPPASDPRRWKPALVAAGGAGGGAGGIAAGAVAGAGLFGAAMVAAGTLVAKGVVSGPVAAALWSEEETEARSVWPNSPRT